MITESGLSNGLVTQKDRLINLINQGMFREARIALWLVESSWHMWDYGYKWKELQERLTQAEEKAKS